MMSKMWKFVKKTESGDLVSPGYHGHIIYTPGKIVNVPDADPDSEVQCSSGIHCFRWDDGELFWPHNVLFSNVVVELEVKDEDIIYDGGPGGKCRVKKAKVVRGVDPPKEWMVTGNGSQRWMEAFLVQVASNGHTEVVELLLEYGADANVLDDYSFRRAAEYGYLDIVKILLEKGADIHAWNDFALRRAAGNGHLEVIELLVEHGADIHANDDEALRWASESGHIEVVRFFFGKGADVHVMDDYALRLASENGHIEVVRFLLGEGADVHILDDYALRWASVNGHIEVVELLLENGANIHTRDDYALRRAATNGHVEVVKFLKNWMWMAQ